MKRVAAGQNAITCILMATIGNLSAFYMLRFQQKPQPNFYMYPYHANKSMDRLATTATYHEQANVDTMDSKLYID